MTHEQLRTIVERYTPAMLDFVVGASTDEIARLEALTGPLPDTYRGFLEWMGNQCPFLEGEDLAYSPNDLREMVYEERELSVPAGFLWIGIDRSGNGFDVYLRLADGAVARAWYHEGVSAEEMRLENVSLTSYLLTAYVRTTLVPSHPFHFGAAFKADDSEHAQEVRRRVQEACSHFDVQHLIRHPDFDFYGAADFVIGVHENPRSSAVHLRFGAVDRARYEPWYDLVFARWRLLRLPLVNG